MRSSRLDVHGSGGSSRFLHQTTPESLPDRWPQAKGQLKDSFQFRLKRLLIGVVVDAVVWGFRVQQPKLLSQPRLLPHSGFPWESVSEVETFSDETHVNAKGSSPDGVGPDALQEVSSPWSQVGKNPTVFPRT